MVAEMSIVTDQADGEFLKIAPRRR